jgi:Domain of unknown function DUF29
MATNAKRVGGVKGSALYHRDYYGWIQHNLRAIRERRFKDIDWVNVAEELEDMGKSERRALRSQLARLLGHLLKWSYQPEARRLSEHSWRATIEHARVTVRELVEENPSLKPVLHELLPPAYRDALAQAVEESNLPKKTFPATCPWSLEEVQDDSFWPDG